MKLVRGLVLSLVICSSLYAVPPELKVPEKIKVKGSSFITVSAETNGKSVKWVPLDSGLSILPPHLLKDNKTVVALAPKGVYRLLAITALADEVSEPAITVIYVDQDEDPVPPPPDNPPGPNDPLLDKLQAIYGADSDSNKGKYRDGFAALYRQAAKLVAENKDLDTYGKFFDVLKEAATSMGINGKLPALQEVISNELKKVLAETRTAPIAEQDRKKIADKFLYVGNIVSKLK